MLRPLRLGGENGFENVFGIIRNFRIISGCQLGLATRQEWYSALCDCPWKKNISLAMLVLRIFPAFSINHYKISSVSIYF
jgi:hypothetical protein